MKSCLQYFNGSHLYQISNVVHLIGRWRPPDFPIALSTYLKLASEDGNAPCHAQCCKIVLKYSPGSNSLPRSLTSTLHPSSPPKTSATKAASHWTQWGSGPQAEATRPTA